MIRFLTSAAAAVLLTAAAPTQVRHPHAVPAAAELNASKLAGYLTADALDGETVIGPPPASDSPRGKADRTIYLDTRAMAGSPRWIAATSDSDLWSGGAMQRYACALGAQISAGATPRTYHLLQRVEVDARTIGTPVKNKYNRTRPLIGDDQPVCVVRADWMRTNASYPSGHAMTGWAWGLILGELQPAKASGLMEAGREVGESRVICGVHYQSDVEAGRTLGAAMVARLHADPIFRRDLTAARTELSRPKIVPANCPA